jgi:hypothetical protein
VENFLLLENMGGAYCKNVQLLNYFCGHWAMQAACLDKTKLENKLEIAAAEEITGKVNGFHSSSAGRD